MNQILRGSKEAWVVGVLLLATLTHVLDFVIMMPLGPMLMKEFNIGAAEFGYMVSVYTVAAAASSFLSAIWVDLINRKTALLLLMVGFLAGNVLCALAPSPFHLILGRIIAGLFGGVMSAVIFSIIGQLVDASRRGRATGLMGTAFPIVSILGVPIGLKIADIYGWRMAFFMVLGLCLITIAALVVILPSIEPERRSTGSSLLSPFKEVLTYRPHLHGLLLIMLMVFGGFVIVPYIAPFLINNGYIRSDQLYLVYLIGGSCSIVSSRLIGVLADKYGKLRVLRVVLVLAIISLFAFTNMPHYHFALVAIISSASMMFLPGRYVCVMAFITVISKPETRGSYMSLTMAFQQLMIGLSSVLGGYLVGEGEGGTLDTFWLAGAFCITVNALIFFYSFQLNKLEQDKGAQAR